MLIVLVIDHLIQKSTKTVIRIRLSTMLFSNSIIVRGLLMLLFVVVSVLCWFMLSATIYYCLSEIDVFCLPHAAPYLLIRTSINR